MSAKVATRCHWLYHSSYIYIKTTDPWHNFLRDPSTGANQTSQQRVLLSLKLEREHCLTCVWVMSETEHTVSWLIFAPSLNIAFNCKSKTCKFKKSTKITITWANLGRLSHFQTHIQQTNLPFFYSDNGLS